MRIRCRRKKRKNNVKWSPNKSSFSSSDEKRKCILLFSFRRNDDATKTSQKLLLQFHSTPVPTCTLCACVVKLCWMLDCTSGAQKRLFIHSFFAFRTSGKVICIFFLLHSKFQPNEEQTRCVQRLCSWMNLTPYASVAWAWHDKQTI